MRPPEPNPLPSRCGRHKWMAAISTQPKPRVQSFNLFCTEGYRWFLRPFRCIQYMPKSRAFVTVRAGTAQASTGTFFPKQRKELFVMYIINEYTVSDFRLVSTGVTGQNIPPAGIYPGLKRPRLDYTRVYNGLGQFIPWGILWLRPIHTPQAKLYPNDINNEINRVEQHTQE